MDSESVLLIRQIMLSDFVLGGLGSNSRIQIHATLRITLQRSGISELKMVRSINKPTVRFVPTWNTTPSGVWGVDVSLASKSSSS